MSRQGAGPQRRRVAPQRFVGPASRWLAAESHRPRSRASLLRQRVSSRLQPRPACVRHGCLRSPSWRWCRCAASEDFQPARNPPHEHGDVRALPAAIGVQLIQDKEFDVGRGAVCEVAFRWPQQHVFQHHIVRQKYVRRVVLDALPFLVSSCPVYLLKRTTELPACAANSLSALNWLLISAFIG